MIDYYPTSKNPAKNKRKKPPIVSEWGKTGKSDCSQGREKFFATPTLSR